MDTFALFILEMLRIIQFGLSLGYIDHKDLLVRTEYRSVHGNTNVIGVRFVWKQQPAV